MISGDLRAVHIGRGLVVWHTPEEWEQHLAGVDRAAAAQHDAPIELEQEAHHETPR